MFDAGSVSPAPLVNRAFGEGVIRFRVFVTGLALGLVGDIVRLLSLRKDKKRRPPNEGMNAFVVYDTPLYRSSLNFDLKYQIPTFLSSFFLFCVLAYRLCPL